MLAKQLQRDWRARLAGSGLCDAPSLGAGGVVLGAGTVLAGAENSIYGSPAGQGARLKALLCVAYGRPVDLQAMGHVKAAAARWGTGDAGLANVHLALARFGRLTDPVEAARRLFIADRLMEAGVSAGAISEAVRLTSPPSSDVQKYNQLEPRVPPGNARASGEWTDGATGPGARAAKPASPSRNAGRGPPEPAGSHLRSRPSPATSQAEPRATRGAGRPSPTSVAVDEEAAEAGGAGLDLAAMSAATLRGLATFISGAAESGAAAAGSAVAAFGLVLIPGRAGDRGVWIKVGGPGDVSYYHNPDAAAFTFRYTTHDGVRHFYSTMVDPNGQFPGPDGRTMARWVKTGATTVLVVSTAALVGDHEEPRLCPKPGKGRSGTTLGREYEDFMKQRLNPGNPTPSGMGYYFFNPATGKNIEIDDCQQKTGALAEYKGPGYATHFNKEDFISKIMVDDIMRQSYNQIAAKGPRRLIWYFAERSMADRFRKTFEKDRPSIYVVWRKGPRSSE